MQVHSPVLIGSFSFEAEKSELEISSSELHFLNFTWSYLVTIDLKLVAEASYCLFKVKCMRFWSSHDWDFQKWLSEFHRFPTIFQRLLNIIEMCEDVLTIFEQFQSYLKGGNSSRRKSMFSAFLEYFRVN